MIVAFTGHRPDKLGDRSWDVVEWLQRNLFELAPDRCISGMAEGVDQLAAAVCRQLRIPWTAAIPFVGQHLRWSETSQAAYNRLLEDASNIHLVHDGPYLGPWLFQKRNEWMVDNCDVLLVVWNGSDGGTANCVRYAEKVGRMIIRMELK